MRFDYWTVIQLHKSFAIERGIGAPCKDKLVPYSFHSYVKV